MLHRTLARLSVSSLAALTLVACHDSEAPLAPTVRHSAPRVLLGSTEQLDQQNTSTNTWAIIGPSGFGQSFTAGKSGQLTTIAVEITCAEAVPDAVLEVYAGTYHVNTAAPNVAALVASQPVSTSSWPSACNPLPATQTWISIPFDIPASVVAGQAYTFRLRYATGRIFHNANNTNSYAGGSMWALPFGFDMIFKTYVALPDQTPPVITPVVSGLSSNGWYVTTVRVNWTVTDDGSDISSSLGCGGSIVDTETDAQGLTFTCTATSAGGTDSKSVTIKVDKSGPTVSPVVTPNPVVLNGTATVTPNASVEGAGLVSVTCGDVITSVVGPASVVCSATDLLGRGVAVHAPYTVIYPFTGFFAPVDAAPTLNSTKAGSAIPVKFSLGANRGVAIMAADSPASQTMSCAASAPTDDLEETVTAGGSSLTYDAVSSRYTYVWKTEKSWAGSCRKLTVKLIDGTEHTAFFKFTK